MRHFDVQVSFGLNDTYMHVYNWLWLDSLKDLCLFSFANARLLVEQCFMMEVLLR